MLREQILQSVRLFQIELLKHEPKVIGIRPFRVQASVGAQALELGEVELAFLSDKAANQPISSFGQEKSSTRSASRSIFNIVGTVTRTSIGNSE